MSTTLVWKSNDSEKPYSYIKSNPKYMGKMSNHNALKATNINEKIVRKDSSESEESNETILFSSLTPVDEERYVPKDLIPVDRRLMDDEWAKQTFRYAHLFDINTFKSKSWENEEQLVKWIEFAYNMQDELRYLGKLGAEKRVLQYFKDYNITMVNDTMMHPKNFDDIFSIIADKEWYRKNIDFKRNLIHMVGYGIFRKGYNMWAKNIECEWLHKYNITLKHMGMDGCNIVRGSKRIGKGFVYSNITMRASNYLNEMISRVMKSNHNEFICVRKKGEPLYTYTKKTFQHFDGYLVTVDPKLDEHLPNTTLKKRKIKKQIEIAMSNGISAEEIIGLVGEIKEYESNKRLKLSIEETRKNYGKCQCLFQSFFKYYLTDVLIS